MLDDDDVMWHVRTPQIHMNSDLAVFIHISNMQDRKQDLCHFNFRKIV